MTSTAYTTYKQNPLESIHIKEEKNNKRHLVSSIDCIITSLEDLNKKLVNRKQSSYPDYETNQQTVNANAVEAEDKQRLLQHEEMLDDISNQFSLNFNVTKSKKDLKEHLLKEITINSKERLNSYSVLLNQLKETATLNSTNRKKHKPVIVVNNNHLETCDESKRDNNINYSGTFQQTFPKITVESKANTDRRETRKERQYIATEDNIMSNAKHVRAKPKAKVKVETKAKATAKPQLKAKPFIKGKESLKEKEKEEDTWKVTSNEEIKVKSKPANIKYRNIKRKELKDEDKKTKDNVVKANNTNNNNSNTKTNTNSNYKYNQKLVQIDLTSVNEPNSNDNSNQVLTARYHHKYSSSFDVLSESNFKSDKLYQHQSLRAHDKITDKDKDYNEINTTTNNLISISRDFNTESIKQVKAKNSVSSISQDKIQNSMACHNRKNNKESSNDVILRRDIGCKCEVGFCTII